MAITLTLGGLSLNDGTTYTLLDGFDPGEKTKTWSEYRGYDGTAAQYNVTEAQLIEVTIPLKVASTTVSGLHTAINALNAIIDGGTSTLVYDDDTGDALAATSYSIVHSPRVAFRPDTTALTKFYTLLTLTLYRTP